MTSIGEHDAAPTSHDAPVPAATTRADHEEETAVGKTNSADAEQEESRRAAAARRDVFLLAGIRKLIKSFRSLSHIFEMYKDGDGGEEGGMDIQIGFPTDVQHVAHIGLDGSSSMSSLRGQLEGARELLSLSANLSLEQFEFAMASLAAHEERTARAAPKQTS